MRSSILWICFVILFCTIWTQGGEENQISPSAAITADDIKRLQSVVAKGFVDLKDPLIVSYSVFSQSILKIDIPKANEVCKFLTTTVDSLDQSKLELLFVVTGAITKVPSCKLPSIKPAVKTALEQITKQGGTSQEIFYATEALKNYGVSLDGNKIGEQLKASIKADDSALSLGYAFWATSNFVKVGQKFDDIWNRIEDVVAQADEVDKQFLQFEGGLSVTGVVINGIVRFSENANRAIALTSEQIIKFGNYLVSRKTVTTPRGAFLFASSLDILSRNKFLKPVFVGLAENGILSDSNKVLALRASDLLGRPLDVSVQLESVTNSKDGKKVDGVEFIQAVASTSDRTSYSVDLKAKNLPKGFYNAVLLPKSPKNDKTLILKPTTVQIKVTGKLGAVTTRVAIVDADQQDSGVKWNDLNKGQKLSSQLNAEPSQKLVLKIATSDKLHQVFVLLRRKDDKREVHFIAQPETAAAGKTDYKLEFDLTANAKDLAFKSGVYEIVLYLGDFLVEDSLEWSLGEVKLQLPSGKTKPVSPLYSVHYGAKPEIKHVFRTPEPRPPRFLSDVFTLIVLSPFLILIVLWFRLGANVKGFPVSFSAVAFHLGLAGIFGVYFLFWWKLTMFEALKWMTIPGLITFVFGHRLLALISEEEQPGLKNRIEAFSFSHRVFRNYLKLSLLDLISIVVVGSIII